MDVDEEYESDSTVIISESPKNPDKIARKRRKLEALIREISRANTHVAGDVEDTAPNVSSVNLPIDRKNHCNDDLETKQWRIKKFLGDCDQTVDNNNDSMAEELRVKKELLKQENYSQERKGSDDKEVTVDFVVISDDSDDDCTVVTDNANRQVDKNTNMNRRICVLTPSAINTRRATVDSFERSETTSNISDSVMSTNPNKVNPKLTVLKPSAINFRRATSFESNEATSNNVSKHVNFSSDESRNKEGNDNNKAKETANKHVNESKSHGEHPPKRTTPNQNVISRKRNSDGDIQREPANLQAENIILSSKNNDIKKTAAVIKTAKRNKSTDSRSVIHSKADVLLARNLQKITEVQEKVATDVVISNDPNRTDADYDQTALKNTIDNVCQNVTVTKNNDINSNVNQSVDARNRHKDPTAKSAKIPADIGVINDSIKENENATNRNKSTDAKRVAVDRHALNTNAFCSTVGNNTNSVESPILQELKKIMGQENIQEKHTGVLEVDEQLSSISKSGIASRNRAEIQTPNKDALCSSTVSHSKSSKIPIIEVLKKLIKENDYQTETGKSNKSDQKVEKLNNKRSKRGVHYDQEINLNQIAKVDNRGKEICSDKAHKRVTVFLIIFFENVEEYLKQISQNSKLVSQLRESTRTLEGEIKHILNDAKKHGASEVRYACPRCSQVSVYSPEAMYQIGDDGNPILERKRFKCRLCRGLQILHNTHMQMYLQNISDMKYYDKINTSESGQESKSELPSTENNNVVININNSAPGKSTAGTSTPNSSVTYNKNENTNIVDDSLTAKSVKTSTSANNDVPIKTSQKYNKNRISNNEKSRQSYLTVSNENDEIASGNDKTKFNKRTVDNNRSPINPKRVKTDTNTRDERKKVIKGNCYYNKESKPRDYDKTVRLDENKAQFTQTLVGCFTKFQTRENYENTETANEHTCPECTCVFGSHSSLIEHMKDDHNIPEILNTITCPLCNVNLNETNYMAHVKVHFPDENTEVVGTESITEITNNNCNSSRNLDTTDADSKQQNEAKVAKSSEEKKGVGLKSVNIQSSGCLGNAVSEDRKQTSRNRDEIANLETVSSGNYVMNKREEIEISKDATKTRDFVEKGSDYEQNLNNSKSQMNVAKNCDKRKDDQNKTNQKRTRKANHENINIVQEAKQANMIKCRGENKIKEHENEDSSSRSHTIDNAQYTTKTDIFTKLHETSKGVDSVKQSHKAKDNHNFQSNAKMITDPFISHGSNTQGGISIVAESSSLPDLDETGRVGEINDINMDSTDDSNKKNISEDVAELNKLPTADSSQNVDHMIYPQVKDEIIPEQNKPQCTFPTTSKGKPILANCYNCLSNIDVNDMNDHDCRQKIVGTLFNCYSCGVSVPHDDTHKCENEDNYVIENIKITKIVTVLEAYVFKCEDCKSATEDYDDVIRHCQNHYNSIEDPTAFCETCQLSYKVDCFETHKHLHEKDMKIICYSYKSLFSNWNKTFEDIPSDEVGKMQARSIYKSHCVKMSVLKEGPWRYTLYQCNQCETCVPPGRVDQHCRKKCYVVAYPCPVCRKSFASYSMCARHEVDHESTELFKIIEFNSKKDESFNFKLFEARKIEMEARMPIADIFKCLCGLSFISNDRFKMHFAGCYLEDKGVLCPRCVSPHLFDANELENHLRLHHGAVAYRFRVNTIVMQQDIETCDVLDWDISGAEDDVKRDWLEDEKSERSV